MEITPITYQTTGYTREICGYTVNTTNGLEVSFRRGEHIKAKLSGVLLEGVIKDLRFERIRVKWENGYVDNYKLKEFCNKICCGMIIIDGYESDLVTPFGDSDYLPLPKIEPITSNNII